jgi:hypothetical protein
MSADLSGPWTGLYVYPTGGHQTPFLLTLTHRGSAVSGMIEEPDNYGVFGEATVYATFAGESEGSTITFLKTMENVDAAHPPITYVGEISADRMRIEGRWIIRSDWSGTFRMTRSVKPLGRVVERTETVDG